MPAFACLALLAKLRDTKAHLNILTFRFSEGIVEYYF
jgi:hypothetical protein